MPVPNNIQDLSTLAGSNYPTGTEPIGNSLDDYIRSLSAITRRLYALASATIASASTTDIATADAEVVQITGTATINSFGVGFLGCLRELRFTGTCTIVHSANIALGGADLVTKAGDTILFRCTGSGVWTISGMGQGLRRTGDRMYGSLQVGAVGQVFGSIANGGGNAIWITGSSADGSLPSADLVYRGNSHTWTNAAGVTVAAIIGNGELRVTGSTSGFNAIDRTSGRQWIAYGSGDVYRLSGSGLGDRFTVDSAGNFVATGNVTGGSDERVKTNWRDLPPDLLESLVRVKHGVYDRTDIDATQVGVGAQSLQRVLPWAVHEGDDGFLSVAYGNAALVGVIATAERLLALEARVHDLEAD